MLCKLLLKEDIYSWKGVNLLMSELVNLKKFKIKIQINNDFQPPKELFYQLSKIKKLSKKLTRLLAFEVEIGLR